ncbi:hypothetical protein [Halopenitus persicus]|uniref:hypothetical protein n=1 Tax=Halopenitus persicus TaxID=1048396 RepID=UPI000BBB4A76|nr:hypothetical protein [Halopenitus persicus]
MIVAVFVRWTHLGRNERVGVRYGRIGDALPIQNSRHGGVEWDGVERDEVERDEVVRDEVERDGVEWREMA